VKDRVRDAIRASRADYTEIRLERSWVTTVAQRGRRLEGATTGVDEGGCVRVLHRGHGWGLASFTSLEQMPAMVERARGLSLAVRLDDPIPWAPVPGREDDALLDLDGDVRGIPLDEKRAYVDRLSAAMLEYDRRIVSTKVAYRDEVTEYWYGNSEGTLLYQQRPEFTISAQAVARESGTEERALASVGRRSGWNSASHEEDRIRAAARRAIDLLAAPRVRDGRYPVVLDPRIAGVIAHEAIGHLSEADVILDDPQVAGMLPLGRMVGPDCLTVGDDGRVAGLRGTLPYDDEGTPTQRTLLIQHGVVVGRLHSRETAALLAEAPTGNARALSYRHPPIVRMTNTFVEHGEGPLEDLLSGIELGVYACDVLTGRTHLDSFNYTAGYGRMIRDGQLAEMVKGVTIAGNLFDMLGAIDGVSGDFTWTESGGGCGKDGQSPLPVAEGAPHVRVSALSVGRPA
jgi:TldD protein